MELPIAIQTALERSEKQFESILERLGLTREGLNRVTARIQEMNKSKSLRQKEAGQGEGRTYYV